VFPGIEPQLAGNGMKQVIVLQRFAVSDAVERCETSPRTIGLRHRHCPVQRHDGRTILLQQQIVKGDDLPPVGRRKVARQAMTRGDAGFEVIARHVWPGDRGTARAAHDLAGVLEPVGSGENSFGVHALHPVHPPAEDLLHFFRRGIGAFLRVAEQEEELGFLGLGRHRIGWFQWIDEPVRVGRTKKIFQGRKSGRDSELFPAGDYRSADAGSTAFVLYF